MKVTASILTQRYPHGMKALNQQTVKILGSYHVNNFR